LSKRTVLIILDGWGHGDGSKSDAISQAKTPFIDGLHQEYPNSELLTDGPHVGLPDGQMGNSEVGHLNIGAGRIVYQDLLRINNAIADGSFESNSLILDVLENARAGEKKVHFFGLLSDGGIHSSQEHLHKLTEMAHKAGLQKVFVHAITDGRDTDPKAGAGYIEKLQEHIAGTPIKIASVIGRYYAMDRDRRWERIQKAYDLYVNGAGDSAELAELAVKASYENGITDEFIEPIVVQNGGKPLATIEEGDVVFCFNFRTDRCREITTVLTQREFPDYNMQPLKLRYITMTNYDNSFVGVEPIYEKENLSMTIGEVLEKSSKTQLRISETEKYPHVTYFFSGGREEEFEGETRLMIPSPKVATYDLQPEMSAKDVTAAIVEEINKKDKDFICLNFANPDMVGHTGVYESIIAALETIDECTHKVVDAGLENGYKFVIIADHGNPDYCINEDGSPNTAHSKNPVPCIIIDDSLPPDISVKNGILADVAPTILSMMGLAIPEEMTGKVLAN